VGRRTAWPMFGVFWVGAGRVWMPWWPDVVGVVGLRRVAVEGDVGGVVRVVVDVCGGEDVVRGGDQSWQLPRTRSRTLVELSMKTAVVEDVPSPKVALHCATECGATSLSAAAPFSSFWTSACTCPVPRAQRRAAWTSAASIRGCPRRGRAAGKGGASRATLAWFCP